MHSPLAFSLGLFREGRRHAWTGTSGTFRMHSLVSRACQEACSSWDKVTQPQLRASSMPLRQKNYQIKHCRTVITDNSKRAAGCWSWSDERRGATWRCRAGALPARRRGPREEIHHESPSLSHGRAHPPSRVPRDSLQWNYVVTPCLIISTAEGGH